MAGPLVLGADPDDTDLLVGVARHLERGGLLAYPTETVYGLGAATDDAGVEAVRALKGRDDAKPFLVLLPDGSPGLPGEPAARGGRASSGPPDTTAALEWTPEAVQLVRSFWPGPLTLVLFDREERFPEGVRNAAGGVAVRVSSHPFVRALLGVWEHPLLSTSANSPDTPVAARARDVSSWATDRTGAERLWIADGGEVLGSLPSTIVDCMGSIPRVLREGAISTASVLESVSELRR